jgi:acetylornithine aminotransferase
MLITLKKEASLPNADPASDSQTAAIVGEHLQYMVATYIRPPPMMLKGEGCYLWDVENRKYLDFTAGIAVNALGHCDPGMAKLMGQQVSSPQFTQPVNALTWRSRHEH